MKTPTIEDIRTPAVVEAIKAYIAAYAVAKAKRAAVDAIGEQAMKTHPLTDEDGQPITKAKWAWRAYSGKGWHAWQEACVDAQQAAGVRPADMPREYCPALVAEEASRKAQRALVDLSGQPFGVTFDKCLMNGLDKVDEWTDLVLSINLGGRLDMAKAARLAGKGDAR